MGTSLFSVVNPGALGYRRKKLRWVALSATQHSVHRCVGLTIKLLT